MAEETLPAPALTPETLAELERLNAAATEGPWKWWTSNSWRRLRRDGHGYDIATSVLEPFVAADGHPDLIVSEEDMAFIAFLRNNAPALIASARRTQQAEAERDACASALARAMRGNKERVDDMEALVTSMEQLAAERDAALKRVEAAQKAIRQAIEDQTKHLGQVTACAVAGSILHRGESDCTEGVIKGLEFALDALKPGAAS